MRWTRDPDGVMTVRVGFRMRPHTLFRAGSAIFGMGAFALGACSPTAVIGTRFCETAPAVEGGPVPDPTLSISLPWSTGFEDGLCGYAAPMGFCYGAGSGTYSVVTSPVHSGRYAAAFHVYSQADGGSQVRCVLQGVLPASAYYGAWYFIPVPPEINGVWNLFHFMSGLPEGGTRPFWDVSLSGAIDAGIRANLVDFMSGGTIEAGTVPPIPIGQWFHIEVYFRHAKDNTGELSLFQDGVEVETIHLDGAQADDSVWAQWYVGNWVSALQPPASTVYVDDITVSASR
jgi:hypothetical protein